MNDSDLSKRILARESIRSVFISEILFELKKDPKEFFSFLIEKHSNIRSVNAERIEILKDFLRNNFDGPVLKIYPEEINGLLVYKGNEFHIGISTNFERNLFVKSINNIKKENLELIEQNDKLLEVLKKYFNTAPESEVYYNEVKKLVLKEAGENKSDLYRWFLGLYPNVRKKARKMYSRELQIKSNNNDYLSEMDLISYQNKLEKAFFEENSELISFLLKSGYSVKLENFNQTRTELIGGVLK